MDPTPPPPPSVSPIVTARLELRPFTLDDSEFIVTLLNDPEWVRQIGNMNVTTDDDARAYLLRSPLRSYAQHGFGLLCALERSSGQPIGTCGLIKRPDFDDVDLGFAFLPVARGRGLGTEAARAVIAHAKSAHHLTRLAAFVLPTNTSSRRLLAKLGFAYEMTRTWRGTGESVEQHSLRL